MFRVVLIAALAGLPSLAHAQAVGKCDHRASVENLIEPWDQNSATYAEGAIRVAALDTLEPAGAPMHLLVISPPADELGLPQCRVVSLTEDGTGFFGLDFSGRTANYDPLKGLTLTIPAQRYNTETGDGRPATLSVTIDQRSGDIQAKMTP